MPRDAVDCGVIGNSCPSALRPLPAWADETTSGDETSLDPLPPTIHDRRIRHTAPMRISAKEDYAVRAVLELALAEGGPLKREQISDAQEIPIAFLQNILMELRRAEIVEAQRGRDGGVRLARPAAQITVADVVRAVSGPLATVRGTRPQSVDYNAQAEPLKAVWVALRANIRAVLEHVTLADLAARHLPAAVTKTAGNPANWE